MCHFLQKTSFKWRDYGDFLVPLQHNSSKNGKKDTFH